MSTAELIQGDAYILKPTVITDAMITSSTVAEPATGETAWSATEINAIGEQRYLGAPSATVTISNGSPAVFTWAACPLAEDTRLTLSTSDTLPTGLAAATIYYIKDRLTANTFTVAEEVGGRAINTTSAGAGVHTATAQVHMVYEALVGVKGTCTMSNATPAVVGWTAHGRAAGDLVVFTTTGGLPTGATVGTPYYVLAGGLTADAFTFSLTLGGTAINTSSAGSGTHTCGLAANYNKPPMLNTTVWGAAWPTAKYGAFDQAIGTYTEGASPLTIVLAPGPVSGLALFDIDSATELEVTVADAAAGTVVDTRTEDLDVSQLEDIYDWFFAPVLLRRHLLLTDLPDQFFEPEVSITLTREGGGTIGCGLIVAGRAYNIGAGRKGAKARIMDFSVKSTTPWGRTSFREGDYSKRVNLSVASNARDVEWIFDLLASGRATPFVYAGTNAAGNAPLLTYAVPIDWDVDYAEADIHYWTAALEGLT